MTTCLSTGSCIFCKTVGDLICVGIRLDLHVTADKCPEARFRWSWFWSVALVRRKMKMMLVCYYSVNTFSDSPVASPSLEGSCQLQWDESTVGMSFNHPWLHHLPPVRVTSSQCFLRSCGWGCIWPVAVHAAVARPRLNREAPNGSHSLYLNRGWGGMCTPRSL